MEFRVLGSLGLFADEREVAVGGPKQRGLLAMLLLNANRVVSRDRLIDGLWGERPPETAEHTLDGYVSRLRKLVGPDRLVREAPGYRLVVDPGELDLERFERHAAEGRFEAALAEWRGEPLADVVNEPFAAAAIRELEERRLTVTEQRLESELSKGMGGELVPELEQLVRAQPFRERPVGQLALALHRDGRTADALARLAAARQRFGAELGLELSPQLRELERGILQQDPSLSSRSGRRTDARRRPPLVLAGVGALAAAGVVLGLLLLTRHAGAEAPARAGLIAAVGGRTADIQETPAALAGGGGSVWAVQPNRAVVLRIDPASGQVADRVQVQGQPGALAAGAGSMWVATSQPAGVQRIDLATDKVTQTIPLGIYPVALAFAGGRLWVADSADESLIAIDPRTGDAVRTITLTSHPSSLTADGTTAWIASHDDGTVTEVDLRTGAPVATANLGVGASGIALASGSVWIANALAGTVTRLNPATMAVSIAIATGSGPSAVVESRGDIWVANQFSRTLSRIDPRTNGVRTIRLAGSPVSLATVAGRVWVSMQPAVEHRGGQLRLLASGPITSMDPQIEYEVPPPQFHGLAYDALVTFDHTGGPQGLQIVPDLALAVPSPTDNGRTYSFRLRPGIRYSDGRVVHASDVRRAFERLYRVGSPVAQAFLAIRGASECNRAACDLTAGVAVDDARRTVVFHLTRLDPEFLFKLAYVFTAPVPPGTPWTEMRRAPYPGTGPYRIASADVHRIVLARNAYFREWSRAAQPQGNPDEIVWRFGLSPAAETRAVAAGRADWMWDNVPPEQLAALQREHPGQLYASVAPETDFVKIDTRRSPFDDSRVRQALNLAVDRTHIARLYGTARPTCQLLPPGVPGYRRYCPYEHDLARARQLVRAAHAVGDQVSIVGFTDDATISRSVFIYLASVVRQLGLVPHLTWTTHAAFTDNPPFDLVPVGWYADYPAASDFFGLFLACSGPYNKGYCDAKLDRQIRIASGAEAVDPQRAARLWAAADRRAVDQAALVPFANPTIYDFTSTRVRGFQHHLLWGFLADQVELR